MCSSTDVGMNPGRDKRWSENPSRAICGAQHGNKCEEEKPHWKKEASGKCGISTGSGTGAVSVSSRASPSKIITGDKKMSLWRCGEHSSFDPLGPGIRDYFS